MAILPGWPDSETTFASPRGREALSKPKDRPRAESSTAKSSLVAMLREPTSTAVLVRDPCGDLILLQTAFRLA